MGLTKGDKDWIKDAISGSLMNFHTQVNEPVFNEILGDIKGLKHDVAELKDDVAGINRRIDKLSEVVTDTRTNHERRIRKLENETGIESAPMTI